MSSGSISSSTLAKEYTSSLTPLSFTAKPEHLIGALDAEQIKGIATALVGAIMERLWIDVTMNSTLTRISGPSFGTTATYATGKTYDSNSKLMKILVPICIERITKAFSTPGEFVEKGLVFDLLNKDKDGLVDTIKDEVLQKRIDAERCGGHTLYFTLKAEAGKTLKLVMEQYEDGAWIQRSTSTVDSMVEDASKCFMAF
jgi:hypothetical protein